MMTGKFCLILRNGAGSNSPVVLPDEPNNRLMTARDVLGQATHRAKVLGLVIVDDFPPALGDMVRGESVLVAVSRDETKRLFLLKVSDGG